MLGRREVLLGAPALLACGTAQLADAATPLPLRAAAERMALYGLPLIETAAIRLRGQQTNGDRPNKFRHNRRLTTARTQTVTAPNNDTLYSTAWLDLAQGPVQLTIPPIGDRYFSIALMDAYTNNFAVLGTRTVGEEGGDFTVIGPKSPWVVGANVIRSPTDWVWCLARILVTGAEDLPAVQAIQDALKLSGPPGRTALLAAPRTAPWELYFGTLQELLQESPPPAQDTRAFRECSALGITAERNFDPTRFSPVQQKEIAAGLRDALERARDPNQGGTTTGGWVFPRANLGDFGQDYAYRAVIALSGLAALPRTDAMYLRPVGPDGRSELDSRRTWRLSFPKGRSPPVDAFWSLTAYAVTPQGQAFFIDNPLDRYAIGDRTPGLVYGADGSLDIWITSNDPGLARRSNWLPAPRDGAPIILSLRAYLPKSELLTGAYVPPQLQQI